MSEFAYKSRGASIILALTAAVLFVLASPSVHAVPVIVDSNWAITRTISFDNPTSAHYSSIDNLIYVGKRSGTGLGLYRIETDGSATLIQSTGLEPIAGVVVDPGDGDIFYSTDTEGRIYRSPFGTTSSSSVWVSGFVAFTDDDPFGMAIAPGNYSGGVVNAGDAIVTDRGNSGPDTVWQFSPDTADNEVLLVEDVGGNSPLIDARDVAISSSGIFLVDAGGSFGSTPNGVIWELGTGSLFQGLEALVLSGGTLKDPIGIAAHPVTGDLYITDAFDNRVVKVDSVTGVVTEVLTGLTGVSSAGIDFSPDGAKMFLSDLSGDAIYELSTVPLPPAAWLFGSGLVWLIGFAKHKHRITAHVSPHEYTDI